MALDGRWRDGQCRGDLIVGIPGHNQSDDLKLAPRGRAQSGSRRPQITRSEGCATSGSGSDRVEYLGYGRRLQEIACGAPLHGQRAERRIVVRAEEDQGGHRAPVRELCLEELEAPTSTAEFDIAKHNVRGRRPDELPGTRDVSCGTHDLDIGRSRQEGGQALGGRWMIVDDGDPDQTGHRSAAVVPLSSRCTTYACRDVTHTAGAVRHDRGARAREALYRTWRTGGPLATRSFASRPCRAK